MNIHDFSLRQLYRILEAICYATDSMRHVVGLLLATFDTTRLYTSIVLQVSTQKQQKLLMGPQKCPKIPQRATFNKIEGLKMTLKC